MVLFRGVQNIDSRTFVLKDSVISGNSASKNGETGGNGGAVYNTSNGTTSIINALAYNNKAEGLGGAIYTASDMTITDSDFGIDKDGNQDLNYHKTNVQNDIYIDGENTKLEFVTNTNNTIQNKFLFFDHIFMPNASAKHAPIVKIC